MRNKLLKVKVEDWCWIYLNGKLVDEGHNINLFDFFNSLEESLYIYSHDIREVSLEDDLYNYSEDDDYEEKRDKEIERIVNEFFKTHESFKNENEAESITFNCLLNEKTKIVSLKYYLIGIESFVYLIQEDLTQLIRDGYNISYIECSYNCFQRIKEVIPNQIRIGFNNKTYYKTDYGYEVELEVRK